jgi:predicted signal transduction protein with EAL and GGDEF domain
MDNIMETLDNMGIKLFVLDTPKEHYLYLSVYFCLITLRNASVNVLQIVGAHLAVASVTKTPTPLVVSRAAVSKVVTAYANHGKTTSAKRNCGQKPKVSERG